MSLRRFLNVAYAILVEEYQRLGVDLISALEKVADLGSAKESRTARAVPKAVAASNEASMNLLQGMLGGVEGAPKRRGRRAR